MEIAKFDIIQYAKWNCMIAGLSRKLSKIAFLSCAILVFALLAPTRSFALAFGPSEAEWLAWPDYCRARYVVSGAGTDSKYVRRIPASEVSRQAALMGVAWNWLHHYCAALAYTSRAASADSERLREHWLSEAESNFMGYYRRVPPAHPMFVEVSINLAKVAVERGDTERAQHLLREAIKVQPMASSPYAMVAMIHRKSGNSKEALAVLLEGNDAVSGASAEIHYFLGFVYMDLGNLDSAAMHAERAYELGYPLPGLAAKLRRLGKPINY